MMMNQPILFGTRVLDLASISHKLDVETLHYMSTANVQSNTDAQFLQNYLLHLHHNKVDKFYKMLLDNYDIDMAMLNYNQLKVPYAVDVERYKVCQMYVAHYSFSEQDLDFVGVDLGPGNGMEWWHNKHYDRVRNVGDYKTTIKILNDGWI